MISNNLYVRTFRNLCFLLFLILTLPLNTMAQDPQADAVGSTRDSATSRENPKSSIPYESGKHVESSCENRWSKFLPILGQAACERGYVLPRPFGISAGYMHQDQPFTVGDILINGTDVKTPGLAIVDEVQNEESTYTLRFDAWILPFLSLIHI